MAKVKVDFADLVEGTCPPVCVRCGAAATRTRIVSVSHTDGGNDAAGCLLGLILGPLAHLVVRTATTTSTAVLLPVCPRHARSMGLRTQAGVSRIVLGMGVAFMCLLFTALFAAEF